MNNDPIKRYKSARGNLLAMVVFTAVNIVLTAAGVDWMFLFKAFLPGLIIELSRDAAPLTGFLTAALLLALYVVCWALSKKEPAWMIVALVFFAVDTAVLLLLLALMCLDGEFEIGMLPEAAFQAWVLAYLIGGVRSIKAMKDLPEEESASRQEDFYALPEAESPILRERSPKGRLIIRHVIEDGLEIELVRARGVTELLADGMVYAEVRGIVEYPPYALTACVRGHSLRATMSVGGLMELYVDGTRAGKKLRIF